MQVTGVPAGHLWVTVPVAAVVLAGATVVDEAPGGPNGRLES